MENEAPLTENAIFVDENRQIFRGETALRLIRERGETKVDARVGMVQVPTERWQEAQRYERRTWMEGRATLTDRNEEHEDFFASYRPLKGLRFQHAIELGCGPFTNLRKILVRCKCEAIDLLDPLAESYLDHPYCRYRRGRFGGVFSTSLIPFSQRGGLKHPVTFLRHKMEEWSIGRFIGHPVRLHAVAIEDFVAPSSFDLCVMINVIEHCRDADAVFSRVLEMTSSGSYFVFADKIYDGPKEALLASHRFDAGHPLRCDHSLIRMFLTSHFHSLWDAHVTVAEGDEPYRAHYFIGVRKS